MILLILPIYFLRIQSNQVVENKETLSMRTFSHWDRTKRGDLVGTYQLHLEIKILKQSIFHVAVQNISFATFLSTFEAYPKQLILTIYSRLLYRAVKQTIKQRKLYFMCSLSNRADGVRNLHAAISRFTIWELRVGKG